MGSDSSSSESSSNLSLTDDELIEYSELIEKLGRNLADVQLVNYHSIVENVEKNIDNEGLLLEELLTGGKDNTNTNTNTNFEEKVEGIEREVILPTSGITKGDIVINDVNELIISNEEIPDTVNGLTHQLFIELYEDILDSTIESYLKSSLIEESLTAQDNCKNCLKSSCTLNLPEYLKKVNKKVVEEQVQCDDCGRKMAVNRFAYHLEKCLASSSDLRKSESITESVRSREVEEEEESEEYFESNNKVSGLKRSHSNTGYLNEGSKKSKGRTLDTSYSSENSNKSQQNLQNLFSSPIHKNSYD
ncbi:hypothetical protein K502DRAFT_346158 [Neoconidiobolus thromboides FSU 785]|nr:hypothetical protein K502DRAFT_346158 [Neoconidiobolus thromboides FSU 785]